MIRLLYDVQTLFTNERNRGIGRAVALWLDCLRELEADVTTYLLRLDGERYLVAERGEPEIAQCEWVSWGSLAEALYHYRIDLYHITSPLMPDIEVPSHPVPCALAVTVYDLIPLVLKSMYIENWDKSVAAEYYSRLGILNRASVLLAISDATRRDIKEHVPSHVEVATVYIPTHEDSPGQRQPTSLVPACGDDPGPDYVLAVVGEDQRKNADGLIRAFVKAGLPGVVLRVVGIREESYRDRIRRQYENLGGQASLLAFHFNVPDGELEHLYQGCLFVCMPSLYEGFGMPILEGMQFGKWAVCHRNSALPEIAGPAGIISSATSDDALSIAMLEAYNRVRAGIAPEIGVHMEQFSMNRVATDLLEAYERCLKPRKRAVEIYTPLPPQKTGIADHNAMLLPFLEEVLDVSVNHPDIESMGAVPIYHMGNNELHADIFSRMNERPGLTVLHDIDLWGFFTYVYYRRGRHEEFRRFLLEEVSDEAVVGELIGLLDRGEYIDRQPRMLRPIKLRSKYLLVHSRYAYSSGGLVSAPSGIIPLAADLRHLSPIEVPVEPTIVGAGGIWPNKRYDVLLRAFARVREAMLDARLSIIGDGDRQLIQELKKLAYELRIADAVSFHGYVTHADYLSLLGNSHAVVCLRYPTSGETSASVLDAMKLGKPVLVSETGSYVEHPDDCVWKVPVGAMEEDLIAAYLLEILNNPRLRREMSRDGLRRIAQAHDPQRVALRYASLVGQLGVWNGQ